MTFRPLTEPRDFIILGGRRSPGLAEIQGAATPRNFDQRRGHGVSGATLRFRGTALADFKVLIRLLTDQHWTDWHAWKDVVARPGGESADARRLRAPALDIEHPMLEDLGIRSVVVKDVLQPVQTADGEWTIEIRFLEYRPPVRTLERTEGSRARPPQPEDPVQRTIGRLAGTAGRLAANPNESASMRDITDAFAGL